MQDFIIGRQQIFDRDLNVFGYELLFRNTGDKAFRSIEPHEMSNQVIVNSLLEHGLEKMIGKQKAFINFTRENLLDGTASLLPKNQVVIEILENVEIDDRLIEAVSALKKEGYSFALDDFIYSEKWIPLIKLSHIIKLDILKLSTKTSLSYINALKKLDLKFLAEKVETREQYEAYQKLGCDYFQGFLFSRPYLIQGQRVGAGQHAIIRLMAEINRDDISIDELATTISLDLGLSYKLLRYINNSPMFRLSQKIESIQRAIIFLGMNEIKRWTNLVALTSFPNTPREQIVMALIRAKMCELLAAAAQQKKVDQFFLTGLMSMLEHLMNIPFKQVLDELPLAEPVIQALLFKEGILGESLHCVTQYECWNLEEVSFQSLEIHDISRTFMESVAWAHEAASILDN